MHALLDVPTLGRLLSQKNVAIIFGCLWNRNHWEGCWGSQTDGWNVVRERNFVCLRSRIGHTSLVAVFRWDCARRFSYSGSWAEEKAAQIRDSRGRQFWVASGTNIYLSYHWRSLLKTEEIAFPVLLICMLYLFSDQGQARSGNVIWQGCKEEPGIKQSISLYLSRKEGTDEHSCLTVCRG